MTGLTAASSSWREKRERGQRRTEKTGNGKTERWRKLVKETPDLPLYCMWNVEKKSKLNDLEWLLHGLIE